MEALKIRPCLEDLALRVLQPLDRTNTSPPTRFINAKPRPNPANVLDDPGERPTRDQHQIRARYDATAIAAALAKDGQTRAHPAMLFGDADQETDLKLVVFV